MEPKEHFRVLSLSIEGLERQLKSVRFRRKIDEKIAEVIERYLYDNVSCESERDSNIFNIYFNLEDLRRIIQSEIAELFPEAEKDSIHIELDPT